MKLEVRMGREDSLRRSRVLLCLVLIERDI